MIDAPLYTSDYYIVDESVPLYPLIVHGCVDYAGTQLNLSESDEWQAELLHLIEYGAGCRYVFTWEDSAQMKYTGLNRYYATTYDSWKESAAAFYRQLNAALSPVQGVAMVAHERIGDVARVTYANGVVICVNYGAEEATLDGLTVAPLDYAVGEVTP